VKYLGPEMEIIEFNKGVLTDIGFTSGDIGENDGTDIPVIP